ncbi:hypothetical protein R3W88_025074 [Solanum pinnatisectum]|uniref:Cupin type-1 domain-containing protein n=1 Tax=Solanum pinnatisectum TaxID=50273 RepID=A0AAV9M281_9SOLN|nr:hypothetical protein R3W88_025074 [Solanum pinnatisectum]
MAVTTRLLLAIILFSAFLLSAANAIREYQGQQDQGGTRLLDVSPSDQIESEGGFTELWDENEEQFQCAGVAPLRLVIHCNSLSLPKFHPMPRLTFQSQTFQAGQEPREERGHGRGGDQHQKVHPGAAHWCYNDGEEELVAVAVYDLNHRSNQLDQNFRTFYLAGGVQESESQRAQTGLRKQSTQKFQNIFRAFDTELFAEAFDIPTEIVKKMQEEQTERQQWWEEIIGNGLEENICTMKIRTNIETQRRADIFSRQAGKVNHVGRQKLSILEYIDMSASEGTIYPNALMSPLWTLTGHSVVYVERGDAQVQAVDHTGQQVMNDKVNQGEMFVAPQYFPAMIKAGENGFEFVVFRTSSQPMNNQLAGYTSVIRAMPVEVLTNAYQISPNEAQRLKINRGGESLLLSPQRRSS